MFSPPAPFHPRPRPRRQGRESLIPDQGRYRPSRPFTTAVTCLARNRRAWIILQFEDSSNIESPPPVSIYQIAFQDQTEEALTIFRKSSLGIVEGMVQMFRTDTRNLVIELILGDTTHTRTHTFS